ncbi:hypothetical protein QQP08_013972 [Theobroma cacao]|nr:hypothetical protein QQP08_013972 [Theobroma cacao]
MNVLVSSFKYKVAHGTVSHDSKVSIKHMKVENVSNDSNHICTQLILSPEDLQTQHGSPSSLTLEVCLPLLTASMASPSSAYIYQLRIYNSSQVNKKHYPGREAAAVGNSRTVKYTNGGAAMALITSLLPWQEANDVQAEFRLGKECTNQ